MAKGRNIPRRKKRPRKTIVRSNSSRRVSGKSANKGSQVPKFDAFYRQVGGKIISEGKAQKTIRVFIKKFRVELESRQTSLERRREIWNQMAGAYAKIADIRAQQMGLDAIQKYARLTQNSHIASFGSGPAVLEAFLAKYVVPQGQVTCIDFSSEMNKFAKRTKAKANVKNMSIATASATATNLPESSQDKVIMMMTNLQRTIHWQPILSEVRRVLKKTPESRFVFSFVASTFLEGQQVMESLRKNNFDFTVVRHAKNNLILSVVIARPK